MLQADYTDKDKKKDKRGNEFYVKSAFYTLRTVQADAKLIGKREVAAKKKVAAAAEKEKAAVA